MSLLHVFDMDGTLLRGTTASMEIAKVLGCVKELQNLEHDFSRGIINTQQFAMQIFYLWNELTPDSVSKAAHSAPWINNVRKVLRDIRSRGEKSLVITMSPDFFANHLLSMGVDIVKASKFPQLPFNEALNPDYILCPEDKVSITDDELSHHGFNRDQCIAYGDSASDIPLFHALKNTVSVNGDQHIVPWARVNYEGENMWEAYLLARKYFAHHLLSNRSCPS
ncbi:hydrolase [Pectobacterium zantedeschiae]|uniref:Hydrolase n=2 Tax=Pectobacterium zantedeschiae TaxID=2034769 RepID=A0A9X8P540_9GAMM|nr:hydrolase [Pectobacterium zantedeschiae]RYC48714.1 hydrolase [Pectobacterium zantedeschiae]